MKHELLTPGSGNRIPAVVSVLLILDWADACLGGAGSTLAADTFRGSVDEAIPGERICTNIVWREAFPQTAYHPSSLDVADALGESCSSRYRL